MHSNNTEPMPREKRRTRTNEHSPRDHKRMRDKRARREARERRRNGGELPE